MVFGYVKVTCGREIVFERTASSDQAIRDFLPDPISLCLTWHGAGCDVTVLCQQVRQIPSQSKMEAAEPDDSKSSKRLGIAGDLETQENAEAGEKTSQEATSDMKDVKDGQLSSQEAS